MRKCIWLCLSISSLLFVAVSWGQTSGQSQRRGILPAEAYLTNRDSSLELQIRRLKDAEAGMGVNHPKLSEVRERIVELEAELETLRTVPNPFSQFEDQGVSPQDIVERLSERELRILVVRLAVDVKDLRKRVAALERFNPSR